MGSGRVARALFDVLLARATVSATSWLLLGGLWAGVAVCAYTMWFVVLLEATEWNLGFGLLGYAVWSPTFLLAVVCLYKVTATPPGYLVDSPTYIKPPSTRDTHLKTLMEAFPICFPSPKAAVGSQPAVREPADAQAASRTPTPLAPAPVPRVTARLHKPVPANGHALNQHAVVHCNACKSNVPRFTGHCAVCRSCVFEYDHHCIWLNNCIGRDNRRFFFLLMVWTVISSSVGMAYTLPPALDSLDKADISNAVLEFSGYARVSKALTTDEADAQVRDRDRMVMTKSSSGRAVLLAVSCVVMLSAWLSGWIFLFFQGVLILHNRAPVEMASHAWTLQALLCGWSKHRARQGVIRVLGVHPLGWLLPVDAKWWARKFERGQPKAALSASLPDSVV